MEFKLTQKHLVQSSVIGGLIAIGLFYFGQSNPEKFFYAGMYNSHSKPHFNAAIERLKQDEVWLAQHPHALEHLKPLFYEESCEACHVPEERWQAVSNQTCNTSGCHPSITQLGVTGTVNSKFDPVSSKYHERIANLSCSACHSTHIFRPEEFAWYGPGFNHAQLIPGWNAKFDCLECHEPFDEISQITPVMETIPELATNQAEAARYIVAWLSPEARFRYEREINGFVDRGDRVASPLQPPDQATIEAALANGPVVFYFSSDDAMGVGEQGAYLESYLFQTGMFNQALNSMPLFDIPKESHSEWWSKFKVTRPGTLIVQTPAGDLHTLDDFNDPAEVVYFLRSAVIPVAAQ
jgi:hypothetical protein